ncbi:hypothetical protein Tco_0878731 [Tanacetum coccineum]|uniref:Transposase (Putative), gypsy type n=1 Tax=Tanacetum coccineum TaxID=301880 RepID=A0ABQ5BYP1_9ASTR
MCDSVLIGLRLLVGLDLQALLGLDLVLNKVVEMISCTSESKPLALPWGRTPRLDSGVRVRKHVVRSIGRSGTIVGQGSAVIVTADADFLSRMSADPERPAVFLLCEEKAQSISAIDVAWSQSSSIKALDSSVERFWGCPCGGKVLWGWQDQSLRLSIIAAAKVSHFEILCRAHGFVPTVGNFRKFYINSKNKGWMSFSKRSDTAQKFPESFLCLVGISRYYELDDNVYPVFLADDDEAEMDLFAFINYADPTKVRIGEKQIKEGQVPLLESTRGRVVPLAGDDGVNIVVDEEIETAIAEKPKKLREDHDTSADVGANTGGKSLAAIHELFEQSTLNVEVGVTATATVPFVTSFITLLPERGGGGHTDSVSRPNLWTQHPAERFVISSDSSYHSSTNVADDEVTSIIKSPVPPPPIMTASIATTAIAGATSALVHESGIRPVQRNIFRDSASPSTVEADVAGPSQPAGVEGMDYEQLFSGFNVGVARQACFSAEVRLRSEHNYRERKKFERKCNRQADLLKEKDTEIANLKAQLSLKEAEAAEVIRLCSQVAEAARINELNSLKEQTTDLEGQVAALESATVIKDTELASSNAQITKLTQDLSNFQLSCDELSIKVASLESKKDKLTDQVSLLETTCSELRDQVLGYGSSRNRLKRSRMNKSRSLVIRWQGWMSSLSLDEEFYPCFLTTIAGRRWILGRGLRLVVMKCLQSPKYRVALGGAIGRAIDKGMQDGLATGIDHGKAGRGLVDVAAYNPFAEANYVSAVKALRVVDFPLLAQLESQKDASIVDIIEIDNHALANRAFIPGRNPELDQYWSESQFMAHGPRGSLQYAKGPENWAKEFANKRLHHGPVDDRWVD